MQAEPEKITTGRGRKYPFRARSVAERAEVNRKASVVLQGVENMVYDITRRTLPKSADDDLVGETVQKCMIWLWEKSLPKFNAWRRPRVKVSTFLHTCASNFIKQERRTLMRQMKMSRHVSLSAGGFNPTAPDTLLDRQIEAISIDIHAHPEEYMTPAQVVVFKAVVDNPDQMMKVLAESLDYARPSSLSMIKRRIRERLLEVDIEGFAGQLQNDAQD